MGFDCKCIHDQHVLICIACGLLITMWQLDNYHMFICNHIPLHGMGGYLHFPINRAFNQSTFYHVWNFNIVRHQKRDQSDPTNVIFDHFRLPFTWQCTIKQSLGCTTTISFILLHSAGLAIMLESRHTTILHLYSIIISAILQSSLLLLKLIQAEQRWKMKFSLNRVEQSAGFKPARQSKGVLS